MTKTHRFCHRSMVLQTDKQTGGQTDRRTDGSVA